MKSPNQMSPTTRSPNVPNNPPRPSISSERRESAASSRVRGVNNQMSPTTRSPNVSNNPPRPPISSERRESAASSRVRGVNNQMNTRTIRSPSVPNNPPRPSISSERRESAASSRVRDINNQMNSRTTRSSSLPNNPPRPSISSERRESTTSGVIRDANSPYNGLHTDIVDFMMRNRIELDDGHSISRSASIQATLLKTNYRRFSTKHNFKRDQYSEEPSSKRGCNRRLAMILGIIGAVLLVVIIVVVLAVVLTRDSSDLPDNSWREAGVIYSIMVPKFYSTDGSSYSRLDQVRHQIPYIVEKMNPTIVSLSDFLNSDSNGAIIDFMQVHPDYGTIDILKAIISDLHERKIKFFVELPLHMTSESHPWYLESRKVEKNVMHNVYIWKERTETRPRSIKQNFFGHLDHNIWTWIHDEMKGNVRLSRTGILTSALLNMENSWVQTKLKEIVLYWISVGVNGIILMNSISIPEEHLKILADVMKDLHSDEFRWFADNAGVNEKLQNYAYCTFIMRPPVKKLESEVDFYPKQSLSVLPSISGSSCINPVWKIVDVSSSSTGLPLLAMGMFLPGIVIIKAGQEVDFETTRSGPVLTWRSSPNFGEHPVNSFENDRKESLKRIKAVSSLLNSRLSNKMLQLTNYQSTPTEVSRLQNTLIIKQLYGNRYLYLIVSFNKFNTDIRVKDHTGLSRGYIEYDSHMQYSGDEDLDSIMMSYNQILLVRKFM